MLFLYLCAAVYMSRHKPLWEGHEMFEQTSLSLQPNTTTTTTTTDHVVSEEPPSVQEYGPGSLGCTYELCAGIVDKKVSLKQSAQEEILEETGAA